MRAKSIILKRLGAVTLTFGIVLGALAAGARPVSAAEKFEVTDIRYEKTYKLDDGKVYFEAKGSFPQIKSDSKTAKKINRKLTKERNKWIRESRKKAADAKQFFETSFGDEQAVVPEWNSSDEISYEVTANDENYFSMLLSGYDFQGGAHGNPYRIAMTFDAKTGAKLTAAKLFETNKAELNAKVRKLYLQKYDTNGVDAGFYGDDEKSGKSGRDILTEKLADMDFNDSFYVKDGNAVFYVYPYELGPYAAGFIEVSAPVE